MELAVIVGLLALLEYWIFLIMTGQARGRFGVAAPATTGHPVFERYFRVQMNTIEQLVLFLPGLAAAVVLHSVFNHFLFLPMLSTLGILITLPPLAWYVFRRSERSVGDWLGKDFDADARLLELIDSDDFGTSNLGQYLQSLRSHFRGEVVADMLCYLRLHLELEMLAKGVLLMRETGMEPTLDPDARAKFDELRYLERSIGRTGRRAMQPFLHLNSRDLWQIHMLDR